MGKHGPAIERFERFYIPEPMSGCWLWTGGVNSKGYGLFNDGTKKSVTAHHFSYSHYRGKARYTMHTCDVRCCVNPDHLVAGTHQDNMRDMVSKGRSPRMPGSKHHQAILNEIDVAAIRGDTRPQAEIGRAYGVTRQTIHLVKKRKTWKHV